MGRIMKRVLPCMAVLALVFALCAVSYAADWSGFPLQQEGARNDYVRALQTVAKYYNPSQINVDAVFGSGTKSAVINYQRNSGFAPSEQDGIVGAQTWNSMYCRLGSRTRITEHRAVQACIMDIDCTKELREAILNCTISG